MFKYGRNFISIRLLSNIKIDTTQHVLNPMAPMGKITIYCFMIINSQ